MPHDSPAGTEDPAWHQALAYAVTGRRLAELGRQNQPDLPWLTDYLRRRIADETDRHDQPAAAPAVGRVPADLMLGIRAAQFWAALSELRRGLESDGAHTQQPVVTDRPWSADELRLMADRPPHHHG